GRLTRIFLRDEGGRRPVLASHGKLHGDPHFRDYVLFHEYFHGDTGRGVGASHQTGWTGLVAKLLQPRRPEPPGSCGRPGKPAEGAELPAASEPAATGNRFLFPRRTRPPSDDSAWRCLLVGC